jgi:hypothetical protein
MINVIKDIIENKKYIKLFNYWCNDCEGQRKSFIWKKRFLFEECMVVLK